MLSSSSSRRSSTRRGSSPPPPPLPTSSTTSLDSLTPSRSIARRRRHPLERDNSGDNAQRNGNGYGNGNGNGEDEALDVLGDVSRPALRRLTTETERQVAEGSMSGRSDGGSAGASARGSLDMLRMSTPGGAEGGNGAGEVEVLIHQVKQDESLPGIALLYGIDLSAPLSGAAARIGANEFLGVQLATLRKINKLWPSDPVHLRTHLYVPLEACRWGKAREGMVRGPGEGQVTLTPKEWKGKGKGKGKERQRTDSLFPSGAIEESTRPEQHFAIGDDDEDINIEIDDPWTSPRLHTSPFLSDTNPTYTRPSLDTLRPTASPSSDADDDEPTPRILDIVRIPSSQLRFFPKAQRPAEPSRSSMDSAPPLRATERVQPRMKRSTSDGPSIHHDLHTLPRPLQPDPPVPLPKSSSSSRSKVVRLRPPTASIPTSQSSNNLAARLSSLFVVPPPPSNMNHYGSVPSSAASSKTKTRPRISMESTFTTSSTRTSRAGSPARTTGAVGGVQENLELKERGSMEVRRGGLIGLGMGIGETALGKKRD